MKKLCLKPAIIIILFFTVCLLLISCGSKSPKLQSPEAIPVAADTAKQEEVVYYDEYPGTIVALNQVQITPQVTGYITGVFFKDGQHVNKGQLLYTLDQQQYQANVLQANANYKVAESNLQMAQQDADRYLFLQKNDAIAKQVVDHSLAALQAAKMQLLAAQAAIQNVRTGLKYATIYAPLSGTIGISQVKPGAAVSPGVTLLNVISSDDPIAADFNVDEKEIGRFEELEGLPLDKTDSTFTIALPDGQLYPFSGRVSLLDRAVDPQTATIVTRLEFDNPANVLKTGMSCTIRVQNKKGEKQILIPYKAVSEQLGEYFVFIINKNIVRRQKILPGRAIGSNIVVQKGLNEGDLIVTEGTARLKAGSLVRITGMQ